MEDRKYCKGCQSMQKIEKFSEGLKTCNDCREKSRRYQQTHKGDRNKRSKEYQQQHPEKVQEWRQNHMSKVKEEVITCEVCNYETKKIQESATRKITNSSILSEKT